jgi:hypothetical protein
VVVTITEFRESFTQFPHIAKCANRSTLIGCERKGRKARLIEIDPKYADVIVVRWQQYTGKQEVLDADSRSFDEITAERRQRIAMEDPAAVECS